MKKTSRPIPELQLNPILYPLRDKFPAILFQFWQCGCFVFFYGWQWPNSQRSLVMLWRTESNAYEYCILDFFFEFVYRLQHLQLCTRDPVFGSLKHNNLPLADPATSYNRLVTCYNEIISTKLQISNITPSSKVWYSCKLYQVSNNSCRTLKKSIYQMGHSQWFLSSNGFQCQIHRKSF